MRRDWDRRARENARHYTGGRPLPIDFAFSSMVFQHIPSREIIESYVREVHRLLRPNALFKFQVQGCPDVAHEPQNSWAGVSFTEQGSPPDGGAVRLRNALPGWGRRSVLLALVLQKIALQK
jgi:hypothetical protein